MEDNITIYMDIHMDGEKMGRILIKLFRDVFPAGVDNFIGIASGNTYRIEKKGCGKYQYIKEIRRTYEGCKFFRMSYDNFMVSGDIYNNNGTSAGTIFDDDPIPVIFGDSYILHDQKGLISLVPYYDENGEKYYDSTFMITLDNCRVCNELDSDQIVIGKIDSGIDIIDKINKMIKPFAGRKYPVFTIGLCGIKNKRNPITKKPVINNKCTKIEYY